ncbi:WXG100 family type VII secretion target [Streptomyces sp. NPDC091219]|uniref:WXG100 family type VII secretion target n=1 Tax=Streptomyces sp. NPDC091219 TaxID=3155193 RepID=UPI00344B06D9
MAVPGTGAGQDGSPDLHVTSADLTKLAGDLDDMQDHLDQQVRRMDAVVDRIEAGWRGPAATAYREFHRAATEDAVRIREVMKLLEQAVRMSRDGFSAHDIEVLEQMRRIQVDVGSEVDKLSTPNTEAGPGADAAPPRSSLDSF